jgi:adenosylhomocysteine nucleosidase
MRSELRPLVATVPLRRSSSGDGARWQGRLGDVDVVATLTGIGTARARRAAERVLDGGSVDHVVVVGVAGGLDDRARVGDVIVPELVIDGATGDEYVPHPLAGPGPRGVLHTSDEVVVDPDRLAALAARGVVALDMETAAIAAVCERRACPWSVVRAISDRVGDGLVDDEVLALAGPDGSARPAAVARFVVRHPTRVPHLARLGRDLRTATRAAAAAAVEACRRPPVSGGACRSPCRR